MARIRMVTYRGFSTRYVAERMARAFAALGCEVVDGSLPIGVHRRPSAVPFLPSADLSFVYYRWMRKDGPVGRPRAVWLVDEPYHYPDCLAWSEPFDWVFATDRSTLREHGWLHTYWLPPAYEPVEVRDPIECEVAFVGAGFPNRRALMQAIWPRLRHYDVRLVGPRWGPRLRSEDRWITAEEAARYYAGAEISLNIHREAPHGAPAPTTPSFRTFEIAACGGFQITDEREDLRRFVPSAVTFNGMPGDLWDKIRYYLKHDNERRAIAEACRREVAPHTFEARARLVLEATGLI